MKRLSIKIHNLEELVELNKIIERSKYESLNIDIGLDESYMVDGRSIIGLINVFGQNMVMIVYGDELLEEEFIEDVSKSLTIEDIISKDN